MRDPGLFLQQVEVAHPKFYLFDSGVTRALAGRLREPLDGAERGTLLETVILHELRARIAYSRCGGELAYYRTPSGAEVDFVWTRGRHRIGIEVKAASRWRSEDVRPLAELVRAGALTAGHGVYLGDVPLRDGAIHVHPLHAFLEQLAAGQVIG